MPISLGNGILMLATIYDPGFIYSTNKLLDESLYAPEGSMILPRGLYAVGECHDDVGVVYILIDLVETGADFGRIFVWRKAHDMLGTGDNTTPPLHAAESFSDLLGRLLDERQAIDLLSRTTSPNL